MKHIMLTIALALAGFTATGCDQDDEGDGFRADEICEVTEVSAVGDFLASDCLPEDGELCRLCCDTSSLGCFCSPNEHRCPNGSKMAPEQPSCPEGTSCE